MEATIKFQDGTKVRYTSRFGEIYFGIVKSSYLLDTPNLITVEFITDNGDKVDMLVNRRQLNPVTQSGDIVK